MLAKSQKLCIISDLDGTLLPPDKIPLEKDMAAIRRFEEAGGEFAIATGRTIQAAIRYQQMLGLKSPMIVYNGAAIYDARTDTVLYSQTLPPQAREMTRTIMERHPEVGVEVLRAENAYVVRNTEYEKKHIALCGVDPCYCTLDAVPEGGWLKVLFAASPEELPEFVEKVDAMGFNTVDFVRSADIFYEMLPKHVTKGSALSAYRKLPGREGTRFIAIGDFDNDIAMLRAADFSAVPSGAVPAAKAAADMVLQNSCETGAMAELIEHLLRL